MYIKKTGKASISKEAIVALFVTLVIVLIVFLLADSLF
jgi:hypothetical protein